MELKFHLRKDSEIKSKVTMIAPHPIEQSSKLDSHLSELYDSEHFLDLYFNWVGDKLFFENGIKENGSILLEYCLRMSFLFIEFDSEKLTQLLHGVLLIIENIVFVDSLHMSVFILQPSTYRL